MKLFRLFLPLIVLTAIPMACKDEISEPQSEFEYGIFDVNNETDWNYWVASKQGTYMFIDEVNSKPSKVFYKPY